MADPAFHSSNLWWEYFQGLMRMRIKTKLGLAFGIQLLISTVLGISVLFGILDVKRQFGFVVMHDAPVIANAEHLLKLVVDMETGQRGFCVTQQEKFLEPYVMGSKKFDLLIEEEKKLVSDNPSQAMMLERIEHLVHQWKEKAAEPKIAARRDAENQAESLNEVVAMFKEGMGKAMLDEIRQEFYKFIEVEKGLTAERYSIASETTEQTRNLAVILLFFAMSVGVVMVILTSKIIIRPLIELALGAKEVGTGNLDTQIKIRSSDEIGGLAYAFNTMASNLKETEFRHFQAEKALKESEEKLSALFTSMTEMVVLHDIVFDKAGAPVDYRITDCNNAFTEILGITRDAAVGKLSTEVYGTDEPPYLEEYCLVVATGKPHVFEIHFAPADKYFSISVISPWKNRFATITTDITAIKKAQQAINTKNKEMEQIVYVASHDLRSPLVNVDGYGREVEYSVREITSALNAEDTSPGSLVGAIRSALPDMSDALRYIRNSTRQMDGLLKGLLQLSRSGRAALNIDTLDMNKLVGNVTISLDFVAKKAGAGIVVGELPPCRGDEVQVTQVFANLLDNALKYLDPTRSGAIQISGVIKDGRSVYCVEDNGVGITPQYQKNIFELFHRLHPSETEGEGLGLTIVRQILFRLDGEVRVKSNSGQGSRFYVTLPLPGRK